MDNTLLTNIITEVTPIINSLIFTVLGLLSAWLGIKARALMDKMEKSEKLKEIREGLEINQEIIKTSVDYAEQIGGHLLGTEKFQLAKDKAYQIMNEKGIAVSDVEIEALIEQVVKGYSGEGKNEKIEIKAEEVKIDEEDLN